MAENKKGFILYADQIEIIRLLPEKDRAELLLHIYRYVNDENPVSTSLPVNIAFAPIKLALKRDLIKFENQRGVNSKNGKLGGRPIKAKKSELTERFISKAKKAVSVSDSVSDKDKEREREVKNSLSVIRDWYLEEVKKSGNNDQYKTIVGILFGENDTREPLKNVLKMKEQVRYAQMPGILKVKRETNVSVHDVLIAMNNAPATIRKNISVQATLINWMRIRVKRK